MGTGADTIALDTDQSSTLTGNAFNLGAALANGVNITSSATYTTVDLGQAGFAYDTTNGNLYYKADGDFSSGSVLVGTITTNGSTAWTYDFSRFTSI